MGGAPNAKQILKEKLEAFVSHFHSVWQAFVRRSGLIGSGLAIFGGMITIAISADAPITASSGPVYTATGELVAPKGFRTWVFAGSDLSPVYRRELPGGAARIEREEKIPGSFHNIYINPEAYRTYLATKKFPDRTMLVMEIFSAGTKDEKDFLTGGKFEDLRSGFEVAVKDKNRPGGGVPWAYYNFKLEGKLGPVKPAKANPDSKCYDCHLKHAGDDNVWVQFYPALRDPE